MRRKGESEASSLSPSVESSGQWQPWCLVFRLQPEIFHFKALEFFDDLNLEEYGYVLMC